MSRFVLAALLLLPACKKHECNLDEHWQARKDLVPPGAYQCELHPRHSLVFHLDGENPKARVVALFLAGGYTPDRFMTGPMMTDFQGPSDRVYTAWTHERDGSWRVIYNVSE